ncbi:MAG: hypothetical protein KJP00_09975, partial [Bacteroidia bacterium]|nr:hypothetical protein [Bacteroidia bacterium]
VQLTYKFRQSDIINNLNSIKEVLNPAFFKSIEDQLKSMHEVKKKALDKRMESIEDEFDTII